MKIRTSFVTNSSSVNFMIVNTSDKDLTMKDFLIENMELFKSYRKEATDCEWSSKSLLSKSDDELIDALKVLVIMSKDIFFTDTVNRYDWIEEVLYYCDTKGGSSTNFIWKKQSGN